MQDLGVRRWTPVGGGLALVIGERGGLAMVWERLGERDEERG